MLIQRNVYGIRGDSESGRERDRETEREKLNPERTKNAETKNTLREIIL